MLFLLLAFCSEIAGTVARLWLLGFLRSSSRIFFDFHEVLALTSILHVFSNAAKLILFRSHVEWRLLLLLGIPSTICVILGAYLSTRLEFKYTELILGFFLIAFSTFFLLRPEVKLSPRPLNAVTAGGAAGFLAGLIGTGGAIRGSRAGSVRSGEKCLRGHFRSDRFRLVFQPHDCFFPAGVFSPNLFFWSPPLVFGVAVPRSFTVLVFYKKEKSAKKTLTLLPLFCLPPPPTRIHYQPTAKESPRPPPRAGGGLGRGRRLDGGS